METAPSPEPDRGAATEESTALALGVAHRARAFIVASIAAGSVLGFYAGSRSGVRPAVEAGARAEAAPLSEAPPWKTEIAAEAADKSEIARLLNDVRSTRASIEAMRHSAENARALERARALETCRAVERTNADVRARLDELERRLDRRAPAGVDRTPIGGLAKIDGAAAPRKSDDPREAHGAVEADARRGDEKTGRE